jgi:malonyl-CoA O-methyltransferase
VSPPQAFDSAAAHYNAHALIQRQVATDLANWVQAQCPHLQSLCDIGAGTGFVGEALPDPIRYTAVDPSLAMLQQIQRPAHRVVGRAENLPFAPGPHFDGITSSMSLPWFDDPRAPLSWRAFLRPQGMIALTTLGSGSFAPFYEALRALGRADKIIAWPTKDNLLALLHPANLIITTQVYPTKPLTLVDFLLSLKRIGAHAHPARGEPLRPQEIMALTQNQMLVQHPYVIHRVGVFANSSPKKITKPFEMSHLP